VTLVSDRLAVRDDGIWNAHLDGTPQDKIAKKFAVSQQRVSQIIAKKRESLPVVSVQEIKQVEAERIARLYAETMRIMRAEHPLVSITRGTVIEDPDTGQRLLDDGPVLAAIGMALRINERVAKAYGTDAATKVESTGTVKFVLEGVDVDAI
jgi:hypothetical protein